MSSDSVDRLAADPDADAAPSSDDARGMLSSARLGTRARSLAARTDWHPAVLACVLWLSACAALTLALSAVGLLIVAADDQGGLVGWDAQAVAWLVDQRRPTLRNVLNPGSVLGSTLVVVTATVVATGLFVWLRWFREAGLLVAALPLEATVFGATQFVVERARPPVPKLEDVAPTASFPSGHTAAAVALYGALAVVVSERFRNTLVRAAATSAAVVASVWCLLSRLYRGAHYPTDVLASVVLATGALVAAAFIVRAVGARRGRAAAASP